ncbi:DMT family transporter [bacterium]|nr:DMT family transporter [bacterium]
MNTKQTGILAILAASIMWAVEPIFAKLAFESSTFIQTSAIRAVFVALTALAYILVNPRANLKVAPRQWPKLVYIALMGTVIADLLYYLGLTRVPVLNAVLLGHLQPVFVVIMGLFWLREDKLNKYDYLGIGIMLLAAIMVTTRTLSNLLNLKLGTMGDLIVIIATFAWATTGIVMRKYLKDMNSGSITFYRYSISAVLLIAYLLFSKSLVFDNVYQILVGVIVGIGTILYYEGLKRIKAAQVSALELSTPFFAAILSYLILGETVSAMQVMGIILLFLGVYFLSRKEETFF